MSDQPAYVAPAGYVGLVTRVVASVIDAVVINLVVVVVGGAVNLIGSLLGHNGGLDVQGAIAGGILWWLWIVSYFVAFWTLTGQTIGNRTMGIRVENATGGPVKARQALRRFAGSVLAALPLGAGFLLVLVDDRRQGLQDKIAHTVVRWHTRDQEVYERLEPVAHTVVVSVPTASAPAPAPRVSTPRIQGSD
ncbi:MAG TPA: RDD family protein [Solirubrobacteraceae bacterium]|jgi:uncharacterized RDD family membrane protein YckC